MAHLVLQAMPRRHLLPLTAWIWWSGTVQQQQQRHNRMEPACSLAVWTLRVKRRTTPRTSCSCGRVPCTCWCGIRVAAPRSAIVSFSFGSSLWLSAWTTMCLCLWWPPITTRAWTVPLPTLDLGCELSFRLCGLSSRVCPRRLGTAWLSFAIRCAWLLCRFLTSAL